MFDGACALLSPERRSAATADAAADATMHGAFINTAPITDEPYNTPMVSCPSVSYDGSIANPSLASSSSIAESLDTKDDLAPIVFAHGNWDCALCGKTGNGKKASRPWTSDSRVHDACSKRHERGTIIQRVERKRPSAPSPSDSSSAPSESVLVQPTETYSASLLRTRQFSQFASARQPATNESKNLAWKVLQLSHGNVKQKIAGGVTQVTPEALSEHSTNIIRTELEQIVRSTAMELGVKNVDRTFVVDIKLLIAPPKRGKQFPHWDRERSSKSANMYTFLLCCTNGCYSAALPTFEFNEYLAFSQKPSEMQQVANLVSDTPKNFQSLPMNVGDVVFFQHTLPHYGVANSMPSSNRVMLFCILSDTPEWDQDGLQVPSWLFIGRAFGWKSKEFAESLVENRKHDPLIRIASDQGDAAHVIAIQCLQYFGLTKKYNSRR
jgi:hypothetical protein